MCKQGGRRGPYNNSAKKCVTITTSKVPVVAVEKKDLYKDKLNEKTGSFPNFREKQSEIMKIVERSTTFPVCYSQCTKV